MSALSPRATAFLLPLYSEASWAPTRLRVTQHRLPQNLCTTSLPILAFLLIQFLLTLTYSPSSPNPSSFSCAISDAQQSIGLPQQPPEHIPASSSASLSRSLSLSPLVSDALAEGTCPDTCVFTQAALENAAWASGRDGGHGVELTERGLEFHVVATSTAIWYGVAMHATGEEGVEG